MDMTKSAKRGNAYTGNARVIEIGSGGIPFRLLVNVDHIDCIRFEEMREEREIEIPGTTEAKVLNDKGELLRPAIPPQTETQVVGVGWGVIIVINGQSNAINFPSIEVAMNCYNSILNMIKAVGIPHVCMGPLRPPPEPKEAVDAIDVHPELAGGEGDGIAENDDNMDDAGLLPPGETFELSDEDLALLENPEIDIDGLDEVFAKPKDPPAEN